LRSYYTKQQSLPPLAYRIRWCQQAILAFKYIHSLYIVHSDISPRNVLLSSTMDIKVCDFGFSRIIGQDFLGWEEISYSRPRPLSSGVDFKNDYFAIGCLLYEILEGTAPYAGMDINSIDRRYAAGIFPIMDNDSMHGYAPIIRKCWQEEYQSMDEMVDDLPLSTELAITAFKRSMSMTIAPASTRRLNSGVCDDSDIRSSVSISSRHTTYRRAKSTGGLHAAATATGISYQVLESIHNKSKLSSGVRKTISRVANFFSWTMDEASSKLAEENEATEDATHLGESP